MTDQQLYLAIGVPMFFNAVLSSVLMAYVNAKTGNLDKQLGTVKESLERQLMDLKETLRAEMKEMRAELRLEIKEAGDRRVIGR